MNPVPACKIPLDATVLYLFSTAWEVLANWDMWSGKDAVAAVQEYPVPFLAMTGEQDAGVPTAFFEGTIWQWFPNSESYVMANAGHYPM